MSVLTLSRHSAGFVQRTHGEHSAEICAPTIVIAGITLGTLALLLALVVMTTGIHLFRATP